MDMLVPESLETERLILRQFQESDWKELHDYFSDAEATRYTTGRSLSEGETWRTLCSMIGHWSVRGYGPYAVIEKSSGSVLGTTGFWYPNDWPEPEIKYALATQHQRKGFASEAVKAVQRAGRKHLPELKLISFIHSNNAPSINLAKSVGATFEGERSFRGATWHLFRHP
ncbi:MAG: GNAT family N-acetyltransferase [Endozoicomonas sp.]|uniref:GNAT family N-acetyltransferase n=1 Tax=Endozoicomonas sp. TaxID=1892382 RepID=UPI003D9B102C